jgi:hypothetical protein
MSRLVAARRQIAFTLAALAIAALAIAALVGRPAGAGAASAPCAARTAAVIGAVDASVADDIYRNELTGSEVSADVSHVQAAADLAAAVASGNRAAAKAAVVRIVFHPHWHIVRLRVRDGQGRVLADVGGAYDIAPVSGPLRARGAVVGSFVFSVQDDTGVTKLEGRFVGDPIGAYVGGRLVASLGGALPATQPSGSTLRLGAITYHLVSEVDRAYPTGNVTLVLLVPPPASAVSAQPCAAVRAAEFGKVAGRFARLARGLTAHYHAYAATVTLYSGALVFVRDGAQQLASSGGAGPATIPHAGTVSYEGRSWDVFSFVAAAPARVYVLAPAA